MIKYSLFGDRVSKRVFGIELLNVINSGKHFVKSGMSITNIGGTKGLLFSVSDGEYYFNGSKVSFSVQNKLLTTPGVGKYKLTGLYVNSSGVLSSVDGVVSNSLSGVKSPVINSLTHFCIGVVLITGNAAGVDDVSTIFDISVVNDYFSDVYMDSTMNTIVENTIYDVFELQTLFKDNTSYEPVDNPWTISDWFTIDGGKFGTVDNINTTASYIVLDKAYTIGELPAYDNTNSISVNVTRDGRDGEDNNNVVRVPSSGYSSFSTRKLNQLNVTFEWGATNIYSSNTFLKLYLRKTDDSGYDSIQFFGRTGSCSPTQIPDYPYFSSNYNPTHWQHVVSEVGHELFFNCYPNSFDVEYNGYYYESYVAHIENIRYVGSPPVKYSIYGGTALYANISIGNYTNIIKKLYVDIDTNIIPTHVKIFSNVEEFSSYNAGNHVKYALTDGVETTGIMNLDTKHSYTLSNKPTKIIFYIFPSLTSNYGFQQKINFTDPSLSYKGTYFNMSGCNYKKHPATGYSNTYCYYDEGDTIEPFNINDYPKINDYGLILFEDE